MRADAIKDIISNFNQTTYKVIMFDGPWGIGKSYAINEALKQNKKVCKISMFGLNDVQQIYHQIIVQLYFERKGTRVVTDKLLTGLLKSSKKLGFLTSFVKERELFLLLSEKFDYNRIIVIDDLERMNNTISLEDVLGIVEELKQCNYIKIILVANTDEFEDSKKAVFDKYNEKTIDRVYKITERPRQINWKELDIETDFIQDFLKNHTINNIRTLKKANEFYEDVKLYCNDIQDNDFMDEIRLICYAIVVESIENLYLKDINDSNRDNNYNFIQELHNMIDQRILNNYLQGLRSNDNLVKRLLQYYQNTIIIKTSLISKEYQNFLDVEDKANYYKSDKEIHVMLLKLNDKIRDSNDVIELSQFVNEYIGWSNIIKMSNKDILQIYKEKLPKLLENYILDGNEQYLNSLLRKFDSHELKPILKKEINDAKVSMIRNCIKYLHNNPYDKQALDYSNRLMDYYDNYEYRSIVIDEIECLYNRNSFPIDDINRERYYMCSNIMYVLYHANHEMFMKCYNHLKDDCDHMAAHRIKILLNKFEQSNKNKKHF